jgi:hypothetical protein
MIQSTSIFYDEEFDITDEWAEATDPGYDRGEIALGLFRVKEVEDEGENWSGPLGLARNPRRWYNEYQLVGAVVKGKDRREYTRKEMIELLGAKTIEKVETWLEERRG